MAQRPQSKQEAPSAPDEELSFEQILERLEGVVGVLERGDTPLEQALSTFERGVVLARLGSKRLDEAERRIEILLNDEAGLRTRPMESLNSVTKEPSSDD